VIDILDEMAISDVPTYTIVNDFSAETKIVRRKTGVILFSIT
jgi:hypothetical protein